MRGGAPSLERREEALSHASDEVECGPAQVDVPRCDAERCVERLGLGEATARREVGAGVVLAEAAPGDERRPQRKELGGGPTIPEWMMRISSADGDSPQRTSAELSESV